MVHLHGTEMKMVAAIDERVDLAAALGESLATMPATVDERAAADAGLDADQLALLRGTRWEAWRHGEFWTARLREQVRLADHAAEIL